MACWIWFLGLVFSVDGVLDCGVGLLGFFGALYINIEEWPSENNYAIMRVVNGRCLKCIRIPYNIEIV